MLGNFSVGDYFKKEAIAWAWEFVTENLKLPTERLWITIFLDDDESFHHWRNLSIPEKKIVRLGEKDNFWGPAGDSGPCGPCSEIHYDLGEVVGCKSQACKPGCDCGRFTEIWNLVFTQYNQDKNGKRKPLPKPNIDTGMGLERVAAAVRGKASVYETDLFSPLLEKVSKLAGKKYGAGGEVDSAMRVVAEHSRGIAFLIGDGVMPSNEGRGYVLRRLLRRATLFGKRLGLDKPFLTETAEIAIKQMGHIYPELVQRHDFILKVIELEETKFDETLNTGLELLEGEIIPLKRRETRSIDEIDKKNRQDFEAKPTVRVSSIIASNVAPYMQQLSKDILSEVSGIYNSIDKYSKREDQIKAYNEHWENVSKKAGTLSGKETFKLYDTHGLPIELTKEIAAERGFLVDLADSEKEMEKQRERARASQKFEVGTLGKAGLAELGLEATAFVGYNDTKQKTVISNILVENTPVEAATEGQEASIILKSTPFYGEMGGQVGDTGEIWGSAGRFLVTNTIRIPPDVVVHKGHVVEGSLIVADEVEAEVDKERRLDIARNHTATHLLQSALRQVLGTHVQQRGSLVAPDRLRFDLSHSIALTREEKEQINRIVNEGIRQNLPVCDEEIPYRQAIDEGAIALFDEKYGEKVRVLRIGKPQVSAEVCGGTHVETTGEIGFFYITSESSIGSGLRRIEAVTGRGAEEYFVKRLLDLEEIAGYLDAKPDEVVAKVQNLVTELKQVQKEIIARKRDEARRKAGELEKQVKSFRKDIKLVVERVEDIDIDMLREISDILRNNLGRAIIVLATVWEDRPAFVANVAPSLVKEGYDAGKIVKGVAAVTGGSGGGKATLAQGGGKNKEKVDEALGQVEKLIK
jgi:alanyl-tRNA synthetase